MSTAPRADNDHMSTTNELRRSCVVDVVAAVMIAPLVAVGGWVAGDAVITKIEARRVVKEAERILARSQHTSLTGASGGRRA